MVIDERIIATPPSVLAPCQTATLFREGLAQGGSEPNGARMKDFKVEEYLT